MFISILFRLALEITFLLDRYFLLQMAHELLSQNRKLKSERGGGGGCTNKSGGLKNVLKKK